MTLTPLFAGFLVTWAVFMVLGGIYFAGRSGRSKEDERNLRFVIFGASALMSFIAFLMLMTT
jgi:hypothetical protein